MDLASGTTTSTPNVPAALACRCAAASDIAGEWSGRLDEVRRVYFRGQANFQHKRPDCSIATFAAPTGRYTIGKRQSQ